MEEKVNKPKKKFLYLDKFQLYVENKDSELKGIKRKIYWNRVMIMIIGGAVATILFVLAK